MTNVKTHGSISVEPNMESEPEERFQGFVDQHVMERAFQIYFNCPIFWSNHFAQSVYIFHLKLIANENIRLIQLKSLSLTFSTISSLSSVSIRLDKAQSWINEHLYQGMNLLLSKYCGLPGLLH
ncbi:MAG: hypothetical protein EZS28_047165 [Streblomastix strix]|uniref:Uncharacterized protein n=1 Tax=Streblomastix strix TaxID=222440 RepID=A0A5J4TGS3_9EUKA|nr:MAG: hypothetical protein EZS28_047165 [Streblomastix strix]